MAAILPGAVLGLLVLAFSRQGRTWREAIVLAAIAWGCIVVGITEGLSLFDRLGIIHVSIAWTTAGVGVLIWISMGDRISVPASNDAPLPKEHRLVMAGIQIVL